MSNEGIIGIVLIILNVIVSYYGLKNHSFLDGYKFEVDSILIRKDYKRLITSGFLHVSWGHLIFNMISLYAFSDSLELTLGIGQFIVIYFASLIGGNLFALFVHRNHGDYSAVGASGAIAGVIFASIALFPGIEIGFIILPFHIPGWIFGILYIVVSIYGIRSGRDNIGHEAHLGGALVGVIISLMMRPDALTNNFWVIAFILIPMATFTFVVITRPHYLLVDSFFHKSQERFYNVDQRYNAEKINQQQEVDKILDKINRKGMNSLTKAEKEKLNKYNG